MHRPHHHARQSPGEWSPPPGVLPAWNWHPAEATGLSPRFDRVPWWALVWFHLPFVDRYAHAWMWRHGGWDVWLSGYESPGEAGVPAPRLPGGPAPEVGAALPTPSRRLAPT